MYPTYSTFTLSSLLVLAQSFVIWAVSLTVSTCRLGRLEEAVQSFTRALAIDWFFLDALIGRGNVFMDFGHAAGHMHAK